MSNNDFLHATLISLGNYGVLLKGKSGLGKSDLALRLIEGNNACLVADDIVEISKEKNNIYGRAPDNLRGLLEVRGVGIVKYPYRERQKINIAVNLVDNIIETERMPEKKQEKILGLEIPQIDLYAKESSAPQKILAALRLFCEYKGEKDENV